ncbi:MAG: phenylacetate-CoA oxygenase subunit PaaJ [Acidimicrobiia bacterium]|nr:phenylacetate-CoA oxygenase subunit PaaJ [Acidimicrobiia bacterium]MDX2468912.1 phenylacetate-CoA oxygenase subunit PaaJ [Acidimicrobiia bacterium]
MVTTMTSDLRQLLAAVVDPEIPVLTIADLGILRDVHESANGEVVVTITPTYSGCPAMDHLRSEIERVLHENGKAQVRVVTTFQPAWTTDWMTDAAKDKLAAYGIAAPRNDIAAPILCPRCSADTSRLVSEFGATSCKALRVCTSCGEPFDHFKEI